MSVRQSARSTLKRFLKETPLIRSLPVWHYRYLFDQARGIVIPEYKFVYMPVQKVACDSMKTAIANRLNLRYEQSAHFAPWKFATRSQMLKLDDWFRFAIVRNPLDRLLSCYAQKVKSRSEQNLDLPLWFWKYPGRFHVDMTFADFVKTVASIPDRFADPHFRSQHHAVYLRGNRVVNFLGRFETLADDWRQICDECDFDAPLPHMNKTSHSDYRLQFTPELAQVAVRRYQRDIELFGYQSEIADLL